MDRQASIHIETVKGAHVENAAGKLLRAAIGEILRDARAAVLTRHRSDAEAVHCFRQAMKRWRALLRLLGPFIGDDGRRLRSEARDNARKLGRARDVQSALDALADLAKHGLDLSAQSLATIRRRMEELKRASEMTAFNPDMRRHLIYCIDQAANTAERWPLEALTLGEIANRLARGFRRARRAAPKRWQTAGAKELHELRKRIVDHRYQMQAAGPLWPRLKPKHLRRTNRLRKRLGKHQDLIVLTRFTEPHQPLAHWRSHLARAAAKRRGKHAAAAKRIAAHLFAEKPKAFRRKLERAGETGR